MSDQLFDRLIPAGEADWVDLPQDGFSPGRITLRLQEPSNLRRAAHPVTSGVPMPRGVMNDESNCRLVDDAGRALPLQTQVTARWPDGSIKWLLLDFQIDLQPAQTRRLTLEYGPKIRRDSNVKPRPQVAVLSSPDRCEITTGPLSFVVSRGASTILSSLTFNNREMFRDGGAQAVFSARSIDGTASADGLYTARVDDIRVEESGPLRAVVRLSGWHHRSDGRRSMPFVVRLIAWAGRAVLGVQHTFIVSDEPLDVMFRGIGLRLPISGNAHYEQTADGVAIVECSTPSPRLGERAGERGMSPTARTSPLPNPLPADGEREQGAAALAALVRDREKLLPKENVFRDNDLLIYLWPDQGPEMDLRPALVRRPNDFDEWDQKYPGAFDAIEGGRMTPQEAYAAFKGTGDFSSMGDQRARSGKGVAKTHEIFLSFDADGKSANENVLPFDKPLFAAATPAYYAHSAAMGHFHPYDPKNFPLIEKAVDDHLNWIWRHQNQWSKWHGIFDYGDTMSVFDPQRSEWWQYDGGRWGWLNGEVDADQGWWIQFLRSGSRRWFDVAEAASRHRMDCDQCHYHDQHPGFVGGMHRHYMTEHWSGQTDGGHIWIDGGVMLYHLLGFRRGLECAIEGAEWCIQYVFPYLVHHADTSRETNNCLRVLARVYEATGDERYFEAGEAIVRGYLCCFAEDGQALPLHECQQRLKREFDGSKWAKIPELLPYKWHGHCGYNYSGYLAPALCWWAAVAETPAAHEILRRYDFYHYAIQGDPGQLHGEMFLKTDDPRYLTHIVRDLQRNLIVPSPRDGCSPDQIDAYEHPRVDYLLGLPYVLAALYKARRRLRDVLPKNSTSVMSYRAPATKTQHHFQPLDLSGAANVHPGGNPFGLSLDRNEADALPELRAGMIGFQCSNGSQIFRADYHPVSAYHVYPSSRATLVINGQAVAGLAYGARVQYAGVPFQLLDPQLNHGRGVVVLGANQSITIALDGQRGAALYVLGHVHGKKGGRQMSQFSPVKLGRYDITYADGRTVTTDLINGHHFDGMLAEPSATRVEHAVTLDWLHVFANMTIDRLHLNLMRLPLDNAPLRSVTLHSADEDWGVLIVAATLETLDAPPGESGWRDVEFEWRDQPGFPDITRRRDGNRLFAPARLITSLVDGFYELELTISGDEQGRSRVRVESDGAQLVSDYCIAAAPETLRFNAQASAGRLALDLIPGPNCETGRVLAGGSKYGTWRSPGGNFVNVQPLRVRPLQRAALPAPYGLRYGWLLGGVTGEASRGGLVVDHEDRLDQWMAERWTGGGFRVDLPDGRYRVTIDHTTYADIGTIFVDLFANGKKVLDGVEISSRTDHFVAESVNGTIELTWKQPKIHCRCPRYAIRSLVFESL